MKIKLIKVTNETTNATETIQAAVSLIYYNDKNNLNIETTSDDIVSGKGGKINIESASDIQFKPGDDIILYSHHRAEGSQDEVALKVTDGDDKPVKLQINASEMTLTTKDKTGNNADVMDITVNSAKSTRGYLKVRAQAIDLRSESHGGIALQPKGLDSNNKMNKIKFEHGGGDGLEFGTFNTEKTSIFTDEYRFNKNGIWKMATRETETSDKKDVDDTTTYLKYKKQSDDFYDIIDTTDETCNTNSIIKTANAFNYGKNRHAKFTNGGNLEIATNNVYELSQYTLDASETDENITNSFAFTSALVAGEYTLSDIMSHMSKTQLLIETIVTTNSGKFKVEGETNTAKKYWKLVKKDSPKIKIESDGTIEIDSKNTIKFNGDLDFGKTFNFGETSTAIKVNKKLTSSGNKKNCDVLNVQFINNSDSAVTPSESDYNVNPTINFAQSIAAGNTAVVASCSVYDIIKLVHYMKTNNQGPWQTTD